MEYQDRPAWRNQLPLMCVAAVVALIALSQGVLADTGQEYRNARLIGLAAATLLFYAVYRRYKWRFSIRDGRIEAREGIVARKVRAIRLDNLRSVELTQGIFQRLLGVGDLGFSSAGGGGVEVTFRGVKTPARLRDRIERAYEGE